MKDIKTIIFDLGGVLMDLDKQKCIDAFKKLGFSDIDKYLGNYEQKALHIESLLKEGLEDLKQNKLIKEVRVLGAIGVIEFYDRQNVAFWQEQLCARGVWLRPMGQVLYIMPPLIIEDHDLCQIVDSVKAVLKLM